MRVDPLDVDVAVLSHLHYDHAVVWSKSRRVGSWCSATSGAQRRTRSWPSWASYHPADFDTGQEVELVEGRHDLFGDGSVVAVPTPGHTAGHQSLLIEGRLLLVGDACYCQLALDDDVLPPIAADAERQRAGFRWLREQAAGGVQLVYSHDPVQWPTLGEVL